ncbi:MAG: hypothetical protein WCL14_04975 [Bacteroidota bacterium]
MNQEVTYALVGGGIANFYVFKEFKIPKSRPAPTTSDYRTSRT